MGLQILVWALCIASAYMIRRTQYDPFFIIGHMANKISTAKRFVENGANALEIDIQFESSGRPTKLYHGRPCDCWRTCTEQAYIINYMRDIRNLTSGDWAPYKGRLLFLMLDLKVSSIDEWRYYDAGHSLGFQVAYTLWDNVSMIDGLSVILSIPATKYIRIFEGAREGVIAAAGKRWLFKLGYAIDDFSEGLTKIRKAFKSVGIDDHRWIGTGITNCFPYLAYKEENSLLDCRRDHPFRCGLVDKAFHWTVDTESSIKRAIKIGYDAVITNDPEDAVSVTRELGMGTPDFLDIF